MKRNGLMFVFLIFVLIDGVCQTESRINEIKLLYKNYNETIDNMDSYEIKYNTAGSYPSCTIFTDYSEKLLIKSVDAYEFGSEYVEYYVKNDTVQFVFFRSERLLDHWSADTVRFRKLELRFYLDKGQVIKALKKDFIGIEGKNDNVDMSSIRNTEIDYKFDFDSNWIDLEYKCKNTIELYWKLRDIF